MKRVLLPVIIGLSLVLFVSSVWAAVAAEKPPRPERFEEEERPREETVPGADQILPPWKEAQGFAAGDPNSPAVAIGEPGLSHYYWKSYGVTGEAYPPDVDLLNRPNGIYLDGDGNVYVAEEYGSRLLKYDPMGVNQLSIGVAGAGYSVDGTALEIPLDVAVDGSGNIWVVDGDRVAQFDSSGNFLQSYPQWQDASCSTLNSRFCDPQGIAFDSSGRLYVSDSGNHRVQVYDFIGATLHYSATIGMTGAPGSDNTHFDTQGKIVIDSQDRLYVADPENYRVQVCEYAAGWGCSTFDGDGDYGVGIGEIGWVEGLGIDSSDQIYVVDSGNLRVKKCPTVGACVEIVNYSPIDHWGMDVGVDSSGAIYISDSEEFTIRKYDSNGDFVGIFAGSSGVPYDADETRLNFPYDVAVAPDGGFFVTEWGGYRLLKYNSTGQQDWAVGQAGVFDWVASNDSFGSGGARGVASDALGRAYVADPGHERVQIFNSDGSYYNTLGEPGETGSDNDHFNEPLGVAISPLDGTIYVADHLNHRVQVFTSGLVYSDTLGMTAVSGTGDYQFDRPRDVTVAPDGTLYVADYANHRVQVFDHNLNYVDTIGTTGDGCDNYDCLRFPRGVAVDQQGRVYVHDAFPRIQVYDSNRAYIATIAGRENFGSGEQDLLFAHGVAVDQAGKVYIPDSGNHRLQVFAPVEHGWRQVNVNGFGDPDIDIYALSSMEGDLYAGVGGNSYVAGLWRLDGGWSEITTNGFGRAHNQAVQALFEYDGYLYAGTWSNQVYGAEIWRSPDGNPGSWLPVVEGGLHDPNNAEVLSFADINNHLFAATASYTSTHGAEVWMSPSGMELSWLPAGLPGFGDADNTVVIDLEVHNGNLYASTGNWDTGTEIWRYNSGTSWSQVNLDGFGDNYNRFSTLTSSGGILYAGTYNYTSSDNPGGELWKCQLCDNSDWTLVTKAFGDLENRSINALVAHRDQLYAFTHNNTSGLQIWVSPNGSQWRRQSRDGFGDYFNHNTFLSNAVTLHAGSLYVGTMNFSNGGEIWKQLFELFLPLSIR